MAKRTQRKKLVDKA